MWARINLETYYMYDIQTKPIYIHLNRRYGRPPIPSREFISFKEKNNFTQKFKRQLKQLSLSIRPQIRSYLPKIPRLIVATASVTYCLYQILMVSLMYLQYKTKVSVYVSEPELLHMPGITVCTNTRILKSKYEEYKHEFTEGPKELLSKAPIPVIEKMSPDHEVFISEFYCNDQSLNTGNEAADQNRSKDCSAFPVVKSIQPGGRCFTYFHQTLEKPRIGNKITDEFEFEENDLFKMKVNFTPNDRIGTLQTGGRVILHDNLDIPTTLMKSVPILPGGFYEIFIKRETTLNLEYPYDTNCRDYDQNLDQMKKSGDFNLPFNRIQCIETCMAKLIIERCNCWPKDIPYVSNFTDPTNDNFYWNGLDPHGKLAWCDVQEIIRVGNYGKCFQRKHCADSCPKTCRKDNYEFFSYSSNYIENEVFPLNKSELNDMALISIRYSTTEYTIHQREPLLQLVEAVCYIGGLIGMYIGFSFISIYDMIIMCLTKSYETAKKTRKHVIKLT